VLARRLASLLSLTVIACGARSSLVVSTSDAAHLDTTDAGSAACSDCVPGSCRAAVDEIIAPAFANNDTASITVGADGNVYVLVESPTPAYEGDVFVRRGPDHWEQVDRAATATGALAIDPSGAAPSIFAGAGPYVLVSYDGAFHTEVETRVSVVPRSAMLPTDQSVSSSNVWLDSRGVVHLVTDASTGRTPGPPLYFTYDRDGAHLQMPGPAGAASSGGRLALGRDEVAWATWIEVPMGPRLPRAMRAFRSDTGATESVAMLNGGPIGIVVAGTQPVIVATDETAPLVAFSRDASASWQRSELVGAAGIDACPACTIELRSVTMVARDASALVLFAGIEHASDGTATTHFFATTPSAPSGHAAVVFSHVGAAIEGARAVLGACGQIHLAYDERDATDSVVRAHYALLGAQ
jgi:hypothetical protein